MSFFKKKNQTERIVPNQDFLHGQERFLKGKAYTVDKNLARYFGNNGWLEGHGVAPPPVVSIIVDDAQHGVSDSIG